MTLRLHCNISGRADSIPTWSKNSSRLRVKFKTDLLYFPWEIRGVPGYFENFFYGILFREFGRTSKFPKFWGIPAITGNFFQVLHLTAMQVRPKHCLHYAWPLDLKSFIQKYPPGKILELKQFFWHKYFWFSVNIPIKKIGNIAQWDISHVIFTRKSPESMPVQRFYIPRMYIPMVNTWVYLLGNVLKVFPWQRFTFHVFGNVLGNTQRITNYMYLICAN